MTTWPWRKRHYDPLKCQELLTQDDIITSQKTGVFCSLACMQDTVSGPYHEQNDSSLYPHTLFLKDTLTLFSECGALCITFCIGTK
jgi:hypothetical protein